MITFAIESFDSVYDEMYPLLEMHYDELSQHKEHGFPLKPQANSYRARDASGQLLMCIARENGAMIGYFVGVISSALHYETCLSCSPDIFYIVPEKRKGGAALDMFTFVEKELRRRGVKMWTVGSKIKHDVTKLFEYLDFSPFEIIYAKWL
jgi:hypothetical protein